MNNLIFLVGLPGAGKTTLAQTKYSDFKLIDDPKVAPVLIPDNKTVIADCHLCYLKTFNQVCHLYPNSTFLLFENDLAQCWENVQNRNDHRIIPYSYMVKLSKAYSKTLAFIRHSPLRKFIPTVIYRKISLTE